MTREPYDSTYRNGRAVSGALSTVALGVVVGAVVGPYALSNWWITAGLGIVAVSVAGACNAIGDQLAKPCRPPTQQAPPRRRVQGYQFGPDGPLSCICTGHDHLFTFPAGRFRAAPGECAAPGCVCKLPRLIERTEDVTP